MEWELGDLTHVWRWRQHLVHRRHRLVHWYQLFALRWEVLLRFVLIHLFWSVWNDFTHVHVIWGRLAVVNRLSSLALRALLLLAGDFYLRGILKLGTILLLSLLVLTFATRGIFSFTLALFCFEVDKMWRWHRRHISVVIIVLHESLWVVWWVIGD